MRIEMCLFFLLTMPDGNAMSPFGKDSSITTVVVDGSGGGVVETRNGDLGGSSLCVLWSGSWCSASSFAGAPVCPPPSGVPNCPASE